MSPDACWAPRYTAMPARGGGRSLSLTGDKLLIDSRELVAKVTDESVQLTEIVIVGTSSRHVVRALILQLGLA